MIEQASKGPIVMRIDNVAWVSLFDDHSAMKADNTGSNTRDCQRFPA